MCRPDVVSAPDPRFKVQHAKGVGCDNQKRLFFTQKSKSDSDDDGIAVATVAASAVQLSFWSSLWGGTDEGYDGEGDGGGDGDGGDGGGGDGDGDGGGNGD